MNHLVIARHYQFGVYADGAYEPAMTIRHDDRRASLGMALLVAVYHLPRPL